MLVKEAADDEDDNDNMQSYDSDGWAGDTGWRGEGREDEEVTKIHNEKAKKMTVLMRWWCSDDGNGWMERMEWNRINWNEMEWHGWKEEWN